jgi:uridylate kinase
MFMKPRFHRILLKVSGESMMGDREYGIDPSAAQRVAEQIKEVYTHNVQMALVMGGGNIFRGKAGEKNGIDRATGDYMGMLATVMNGLALQDALEKVGVPTRVQSALQMPAVAESFIRRRAMRHMEKGRVVILVAGTGVPYVTTDTGASLHALELHCDVLMKATKVDGVFDKDPVEIMDTAALAMCQENNMAIMVFELFKADNLIKAVTGEDVGTYVDNVVETKLA